MLETLYKQILFYTENGKSWIDHPNFLIQETHKISGCSRKDLIVVFEKLTEIGFLEKVENQNYAFQIKKMMTLKEIESVIQASS